MFSATLSPSDVDELPLSDNPGDLLVVGPAARIIGRQGSRRVILLQPALLGETIIVPLVIELGADDRPIPEQDGHQLGIRPSLTARKKGPVPCLQDGGQPAAATAHWHAWPASVPPATHA